MSTPKTKERLLPCFPPEDYKGTQVDWMIGLQEDGYWDGKGYYGDCTMPESAYWALLDRCEGVKL